MPTQPYRVPIHTMRFALNAMGELPRTLSHADFDGISPELVEAVLEEAIKFATNELAPLQTVGDKTPCKRINDATITTPPGFKKAYELFIENGWNGAGIALSRGGQGMPATVHTLISEMWQGANMAFALCPMLTQSAIELISAHGTVEQQLQYLTNLISGEWTGTMCMTEPQAGSDVGLIKTRATPEGHHYRINGSKIYITWGEHDMAENIVHIVLARLDGAPPGSKGLSLFLVPKFLVDDKGQVTSQRNEITCSSIEHKMGLHGSPTCVLNFGVGTGAVGYLLGEPNEGMKAMFTMMNAARIAVGIQGLGALNYALQLAEYFVQERVQGKKHSGEPAKLMDHPDIQRMLLTMQGHDLALRLLAVYMGRKTDELRISKDPQDRQRAQERIDLLTPVFKAQATRVAFEGCSDAMQIFGGMGYIEESGIPQLLRDVRVAMIYEGTNGIQALDLIGRKLTTQNGTFYKDLVREMAEAAVALQQSGHPLLKKLAPPMVEAAKHVELVSLWALQRHQENTEKSRQAIALMAEDFLRVVSYAVEGWMLSQAAHQAASDENYHRYLPRIGFFMHYILPQTYALSQRVINSDAVTEWLPRG